MKKLYIFGLFVLLLSFSGSVYADQCTPPTPPTCYTTVTTSIYPPQGRGYYGPVPLNGGGVVIPDSTGAIGHTTQQVEVTCGYTDPKYMQYSEDLISYNVCLQTNRSNSNTYSSQPNTSYTSPLPDCPNPFTQDQKNIAKQKSDDAYTKLNQITSDYNDKLTQYNNGTFTLSAQEQPDVDSIKTFYESQIQQQITANKNLEQSISTASSLYGGSGVVDNSILQKDQQKITDLQKQRDTQIAITIGSFGKSRAQALDILYQINYKQANDNYNRALKISSCPITDSQLSIPIKSTTPTPPIKSSSCPANSTLGGKANLPGICSCDQNFYPIFKDDSKEGIYNAVNSNDFKCVTHDEMMQDEGVKLYGPEAHYNAIADNYSCNSGYVFKTGTGDKNDKCILSAEWYAKNNVNQATSSSQTSIKIIQKISPAKNNPTLTTIKQIASTSTPTTTSIKIDSSKTTNQKHWYQWLNPFSWFK